MKTLFKDKASKLEIAILDDLGEFVSGLTIIYQITNASDDSFVVSGITTEINNTYTFTYTFISNGEYRLKYITPEDYENGFEQITVVDDYISTINDIEIKIKAVLGLSQENFRIKDHVYDANNSLESAIIRTYNNASDCNNDINPLYEYSMAASYDANNRLISYKVVKN